MPIRATLIAILISVLPLTQAVAGTPHCPLSLEVDARHRYGEQVVLRVSGLPGVGGIDIYTQHRNATAEEHLFLVPGITEFEYLYAWSPPGLPPTPPLAPGHYVVHAIDASGCEARTHFHVTG